MGAGCGRVNPNKGGGDRLAQRSGPLWFCGVIHSFRFLFLEFRSDCWSERSKPCSDVFTESLNFRFIKQNSYVGNSIDDSSSDFRVFGHWDDFRGGHRSRSYRVGRPGGSWLW